MPVIPQSSQVHAHTFAEKKNSYASPPWTIKFARCIIPPSARRPALVVCLLIGIPLMLFLLIRSLLMRSSTPTPLHAPRPRPPFTSAAYQQDHQKIIRPRKEADEIILRSTWPPESCVTLAPEAENLPSPTIRWNPPSTKNAAPPPPFLPRKTRILRMKTWPVAGGGSSFLRSETMEELNGCRRHVMVFGTPGWNQISKANWKNQERTSGGFFRDYIKRRLWGRRLCITREATGHLVIVFFITERGHFWGYGGRGFIFGKRDHNRALSDFFVLSSSSSLRRPKLCNYEPSTAPSILSYFQREKCLLFQKNSCIYLIFLVSYELIK